MAAKKKPSTPRSPLIGNQAKPTVLDDTTKLDIDTKKTMVDNIIDAGLTGKLDTSEIDNFTNISNSRDQVYQLIDTMCKDSSVSSIVRTYAEDVCEMSDNGHIMWCESNDPKVSKFVNYLLNVMNVDKNIYGWTYSLLKYGDVYLRLYRESDYDDRLFSKDSVDNAESTRTLNEAVNLNVHSSNDPYSYYVEMIPDPSTMFELTKYGKTYGYIEVPNMKSTGFDTSDAVMGGQTITAFNYKLKSTDVNVYQADDFAHACLEDNFSRFPETVQIFTSDNDYTAGSNALTYTVKRGKSLLYDSYKIWREKALLENAALLNRITRSSILRKVSVEVGDMSKEQVQQTLRRVKDMMEQKTALNKDGSMAEYNNPGPMENNIYFATHNGQGAITVDSVGGDVEVKSMADLDWWNNKFYSSYGIPKQYFGWTDDGAGFNGGTSLTILSSVYAKGIKRVQNSVIQMVTDVINLILINKGLKSYINNFVLKIKAPVTQEEIDYRDNMANRINAINNLNSLLTDVEDKSRRLKILKSLISSLNYNDDVVAEIQGEINSLEEAKKKEAEAKKAEEEADKAKEAAEKKAAETAEEPKPEEAPEGDKPKDDAALSLTPMPDSAVKESLDEKGDSASNDALVEDSDNTLPSPEEADKDKDFTENK
jgi:hypothetical protein